MHKKLVQQRKVAGQDYTQKGNSCLPDKNLFNYLIINILYSNNVFVRKPFIQKLNRAVITNKFKKQLLPLQDKHIVFIFDECHRSQFGSTHKRIKEFFHRHQMFGFTGRPIFVKNATRNELGKRTTKDLFDKRLHQYVLPDAIRDGLNNIMSGFDAMRSNLKLRNVSSLTKK